MTDAEDAAVDLVESLRSRLGVVETRVHERRQEGHEPPRVVGVEWLDPPFAIGHWVPEQIRRAGGWDLLGQDGERSRETDWESVAEVDPEMIVLMPCGYHLRETVDEWARTPRPIGWKSIEAVRRGNVFAVDGSAYFSRPGPRVIDGIEMLAEIFDPGRVRRDLAARQLDPADLRWPDRRWLRGRRSTACGAVDRGRRARRRPRGLGEALPGLPRARPATTRSCAG